MMVVPLVVASVMSSSTRSSGTSANWGWPGGFAIAYYLTTTVMAVIVGLIMVNFIQPGIGAIDADTLETMAAQGQEITAGREDEGLSSILGNLVADAVYRQSVSRSPPMSSLLHAHFLLRHLCRHADDNGQQGACAHGDDSPDQQRNAVLRPAADRRLRH